MSTNTLEQLKQAKSALEAERKPVSHVQEALKATKDITQFVKIALSKENRWIFQADEQDEYSFNTGGYKQNQQRTL